MKKFYILSLLILIFIADDTYAPQRSAVVEPTKFKVGVRVSCEDESLKNLIESHIRRELRALHDVEVKGSVDIYTIDVVVIENEYITGEKTSGLSIATMFTRLYLLKNLEPYLSNKNIFFRDVMDSKIPLLFYRPEIYAASHSKSRIDEFCQSTVANFDIQMLEPERKKR